MPKLTIDMTGRGGLVPKFKGDIYQTVTSPNRRYIANENQMVSGFFNPLIRDGYLSPSNYSYKTITGTGTTSTYGGVARAFFDDLSESAKVFMAADTRSWISATLGSYGADGYSQFSSSATTVGTVCDLEMYQINEVRKLLIASTNKISIYDTATDTYDTAWSTTTASGALTPTASDYSRLVKSDNGFAYWFVGNKAYKIDGTAGGGANGTISLALTFPVNLYLYDGLSTRGKLLIAVNPEIGTSIRNNAVIRSEAPRECGIYVWDRSSAVTSLSDFYPIPGAVTIRKIYTAANGETRVIAVGTNRLTNIYKFTGSDFVLLHELPINAYPNQPKGLAVGTGVDYWLGQNGIFYANFYIDGRDTIVQLLDCNAVATEIAGVTRTIARAGAILLTGRYDTGTIPAGHREDFDAIIIGFRDSNGDDRVIRYLPHAVSSFDSVTPKAAQGDVYTPVKFFPSLSTVQHATIYCLPTSTTGTDTIATIKFYANQSTTAFKSFAVTQNMAKRGYVSVELNKPFVNTIQMEVEWATSAQLGVDDFCPTLGVIDYVSPIGASQAPTVVPR